MNLDEEHSASDKQSSIDDKGRETNINTKDAGTISDADFDATRTSEKSAENMSESEIDSELSATTGQQDSGGLNSDSLGTDGSRRRTTLIFGGIFLIVVLIIAGLFLPPISLAERLGLSSNEEGQVEAVSEQSQEETAPGEMDYSLILLDQDKKATAHTMSRDDFLNGTDSDWTDAANSMPHGTMASDLYIVEYKDEAPDGRIEILIPDSAQPYQTLDLYEWDGDSWFFSPSELSDDGSVLSSIEGPLPQAFAMLQSESIEDPEIAAEVLPTQDLPAEILPYLTEVIVGTKTLGPDGSAEGLIAELPMGGYRQFVRATNTGAIVDTVSLTSLLSDPAAQARNIQNLVDAAASGPYAGVNLDYQGVHEEQRTAFSQFVSDLADALHQADLDLHVTLEAPILTEEGWDASGQDWIAMGQVADAVFLQMPLSPMAYGDNGLAEQVLLWATRQVERGKLSMLTTANAVDAVGESHREVDREQALTNYGEISLINEVDQVSPGESIEVALSGSAGSLEWDPDSLTYKYTYEQAGQEHSMWLSSEAVLSHRNRLANRYHLRGIAARGLGNLEEAEGYANAFASYLGETDPPQPASAAIVWAVEDEDGGIVASSSGEEMSFIWEGTEEPGRYVIKADFAQGDNVSSLGTVEVLVQAPATPTPTPEPTSEPEIEETPAAVVSGGASSSVDPGDADAVANTPANVRNGPGLGYGIIGGLDTGEKVTLIGRNSASSWLQIEMADETEGWVFAQLLTVNSELDLNLLAVVEVEPPVVASGDGGDGSPPPAPVIPPAGGGSFELGGQTHSLANPTLMSMAGMNWVKFQHKWGPGDSPDAVAGRIQQAHGNGFKVLLSIPGASTYPSSIDFSGYVEFLRGVAALGPDAIEIWNEENIDFEWPAGQISPSAYVNNMLAPAYNAIKSVNSSVMVISGAPAPTGYFGGGCSANGCDDNAYMAGVAAAGGGSYMDCIGVHFNAGATSPNATSGHPAGGSHYSWYFWPTLNMYYNAFGGSRPVCFTELGFLSGQDFGGVPPRFSWAANTTVAQHAQWLAEAASLSANSGKVRMLIVFNVDFTHYGDDPQAGYAMLRPDGSCPSCDLLRQVMGG